MRVVRGILGAIRDHPRVFLAIAADGGGAVDPGPAGGPLRRAPARRLLHLQSLAEAPARRTSFRRRSRSGRSSTSSRPSPSSGSPRTALTAAPSGASRWTSPIWRASCSWPASSARTSPSSRVAATRPAPPGRARRRHSPGGIAGMLTSVVGLSTGPCSVMGCGAPVIPVVGLAFAGLSSGTLAFLASLSRITTLVIFGRSRRPSSSWAGRPAVAARPATPARTPVPRTLPDRGERPRRSGSRRRPGRRPRGARPSGAGDPVDRRGATRTSARGPLSDSP